MSTAPESITEDPEQGTAKTVTKHVSLQDVVRHAQAEVTGSGARPTDGYVHRLRSDELTRPPLMYQSANVTSHELFAEHGNAVAPAVTALDAMHAALASIIDARIKSTQDPTLLHSEASQILAVAAYADRQMDAAARRIDAATKHIEAQIDAAEGELRKGLPSSASPLSSEVRAHAKAQKHPLQFVSQLIADGDEASVAAVLGAPAYLSGLNNDMKAALTHQWNSRKQPQLTQKLTLLRATQDRLERAGRTFITNVERAQGVDYRVIQRLRQAKQAATF